MAKILDNSGNDRLSPARPPEDDAFGLGELLRHARERRGLTLQQISNETKIPRRHLEAIERDNLAGVPGGFYRRAQIRTFAKAVDLDPGLALARLERMSKIPAPREVAPETPTVHGPASSGKRLLIVIGVGVAAIAFVRSIGRQPLPVPDGQERAAADSPQVAPRGPERLGDAVAAMSQRTPLDPVPPQPAIAEGPLAAATERPDAGASTGTIGEVAVNPDPPKPAARDSVTELVVTTQPPGARVTVDGIGWGSTPATIRFLPAGSKRVRVIKEGYTSAERVVNVVEGRRSALQITLPAAP